MLLYLEAVEMRDIFNVCTFADEGVLYGVFILMTKGDANHQRLIIRNLQVPAHRTGGHNPAGLRAGMQPLGTCCQHDGLDIQANIKPAAAAQIGISGNEDTDRCIKQQIVACCLPFGPFTVTLLDAKQSI